MNAWAGKISEQKKKRNLLLLFWENEKENQNVGKVKMVPDGSGEFTRKMGYLVNKDNLGFGSRSWRYSALIDDGKIEKIFVEPGMTISMTTGK